MYNITYDIMFDIISFCHGKAYILREKLTTPALDEKITNNVSQNLHIKEVTSH